MTQDLRFAERIAESLSSSWDHKDEKRKEFYLEHAKKFIEAVNQAGIGLYDIDDHR